MKIPRLITQEVPSSYTASYLKNHYDEIKLADKVLEKIKEIFVSKQEKPKEEVIEEPPKDFKFNTERPRVAGSVMFPHFTGSFDHKMHGIKDGGII